MSENNRIGPDDSLVEAVAKVAKGNPGAVKVLLLCMKYEKIIDPDSAIAPMSALLDFDNMGVYGPNVWVLCNDVCGRSIPRLLGLLRARQLGLLDEAIILRACNERSQQIPNLDELLVRVKEKLPRFQLDFDPIGG